MPGIWRRPRPGGCGSTGRWPGRRRPCRSCTRSTASAGSPRSSCPGSAGTKGRRRSGSATRRRGSSSSTSTASSPPPCTNAAAPGSNRPTKAGQMAIQLYEGLEELWREPDDGIWEVRGPRRHFTHSKMMAWVAFDRAVRAIEEFHLDGPVDRWRAVRDEIHAEVCREGFNAAKNAFVQYYGSDQLDASLLMMCIVGFLPASDPRVKGTIEAIERELPTRTGSSTATSPRRRRRPPARRGEVPPLLVLADRQPVRPRPGGRRAPRCSTPSSPSATTSASSPRCSTPRRAA